MALQCQRAVATYVPQRQRRGEPLVSVMMIKSVSNIMQSDGIGIHLPYHSDTNNQE